MRSFPVVLQQFNLNVGSGGAGLHPGGDGVVRELLFRRPLTLSVLTERRVFRPYGLKGWSIRHFRSWVPDAGADLVERILFPLP